MAIRLYDTGSSASQLPVQFMVSCQQSMTTSGDGTPFVAPNYQSQMLKVSSTFGWHTPILKEMRIPRDYKPDKSRLTKASQVVRVQKGGSRKL